MSEEKVHELRAIVATFPSLVPSISQKTPEVSEIVLNGNNVTESLEKVRNVLGKPVNVTDVLSAGQLIDVTAVTKGKGTQGPV